MRITKEEGAIRGRGGRGRGAFVRCRWSVFRGKGRVVGRGGAYVALDTLGCGAYSRRVIGGLARTPTESRDRAEWAP